MAVLSSLQSSKSITDMDFRLRHLVSQRKRGIKGRFASSQVIDEVNVIAKISNLSGWKKLTQVEHKSEIRNFDVATGQKSGWIVTGRLLIDEIESVRKLGFVKSLKLARKIQSNLHQTIPDIEAGSSLPRNSFGDLGENCVVGVIDYGGDFAHQNFQNTDGSTRLISIWNQNGPFNSGSPQPYGYGTEYSRDQINAAIRTQLPYNSLGYGPNPDLAGRPPGSHGTHVMDIAAGNGRGSGYPGVAQKSDLIFVEVKTPGLHGEESIARNFGDSVLLVEAAQYIFDKAGNRPCVINISLGTNGGPHDGTTLVEQALDNLVRQQSNRAIVIAAANAYTHDIHAMGNVAHGTYSDVEFFTPLHHPTVSAGNPVNWNEFELWYDGQDYIDVELFDPSGNSLVTLSPGEEASTPTGDLFISNRRNDPNNNDNYIGIILHDTLPSGNWKVRLHGRNIQSNGQYHAWLERDNYVQSNFLPGSSVRDYSLGSISCGHETITVGSYSSFHLGNPISVFSGAGPTRDGRQKPEISAPGTGIYAAHSRTGKYIVKKSGTSMATPAVAGVIALMLSEAAARGKELTSAEIRQLLLNSTATAPTGTGWDNRYGYGMLRAAAAVQAVINF